MKQADEDAAPEPDLEPIRLEITDILDLHTFAPRETGDAVKTYLEEARTKGYTTVRIIHGKGIGVQREIVHSILSRTEFVASYQDAPAEAGSWGATVVWFKPQ
ncbi:MAG: Smr/MutS family protein [Acidobacteria bacterium]|nr:Smr/MutS family protein [Acidobacteriota bacterium]